MSKKIHYTWAEFDEDVFELSELIGGPGQFDGIYGIPRGGVPVAVSLSFHLGLPLVSEVRPNTLVVDDLVDSGTTMAKFPNNKVAVLHVKPHSPRPAFWVSEKDGWLVYPWEETEEQSIQDSIVRTMQFIGEDPSRPGVVETPSRVARSYGELYAGYKQDPAEVFKVFDEDGYNELVWLKNIEFYAMCEHHMLPFFGKAHVAYIPADQRVIGASKMARLVDIFARRMTTQERLAMQVADSLMKYLKPQAAACIVEGVHLCMRCRGVSKQNTVMGTSCLRGLFMEDTAARAELIALLKE